MKSMKYMFYGCKNLENINLLSFHTINVIDMSHMFELCENLKYLDLSSFSIREEVSRKNMFFGSYFVKNTENLYNLDFKELKELDLSNNEISDISVLEKINFNEIKQLNISRNEISDIKVL